MARITSEGDIPSVYEETTVRHPAAGGPTTVVDDGSGFGFGVVAGVLVAIVIAVLAVLWATGTFRGTTHNSPGTTVTSTAPGSNGTGTTGGTGSGGTSNGGGSSTTP